MNDLMHYYGIMMYALGLIIFAWIIAIMLFRRKYAIPPSTYYTVRYKMPQWLFWRKLTGVKGDGILFGGKPGAEEAVPSRYFILADNSRVEMPLSMIFKYDVQRLKLIEEEIRRRTTGG